MTSNKLVEFPPELQEVENFANWVHEAIRNRVAQGSLLEDEDAIHPSIQPQFSTSIYIKLKAYGNHYRVSLDAHGTTMAAYDSGVTSVFQQAKGQYTWSNTLCGGTKVYNSTRLWTPVPTSCIVEM
jgi:hypothetical protein